MRVVSMPNRERFLRQSQEYQESVLAAGVPTLVVEAGVGAGWRSIAGANGRLLTIERFGASGPAAKVAEHLGITVDNAVRLVKEMLG